MTLNVFRSSVAASFIRESFQRKACSRVLSSSSGISSKDNASIPWGNPELVEKLSKRKRNNNSRFRQHVNPLARQYQQPTPLSDDWPRDVFSDCSKPLHIDIGCGKGGFLIDVVTAATAEQQELPFNYLGLEIRPGVALYAKERVGVHGATGSLEFLGCNANVDLDRILQRYHDVSEGTMLLHLVSIQYPDPHFKSQHQKRRVVTQELIDVLAKYMPPDARVFLQSDIQSVLDDMRLRFRGNSLYFTDAMDQVEEYIEENPLGVPTEREVSVLKKGLPVYRSMFTRNVNAQPV
jgi:tRNA (guanine-N7-)-methyltransferase